MIKEILFTLLAALLLVYAMSLMAAESITNAVSQRIAQVLLAFLLSALAGLVLINT